MRWSIRLFLVLLGTSAYATLLWQAAAPRVGPVERVPGPGSQGSRAFRALAGGPARPGTLAPGIPVSGTLGAAPGLAITGPTDIIIPVLGIQASQLKDTFEEGRTGHVHHAIDILAPRGTPVLAAVDGKIAKLFVSAAGGLTIYQFDRAGELVYYYAHLDSYAPSIVEGMEVRQGAIIGYVGTTGNAPPGTPHLHFAIEKLGPEKVWWRSEAIDPYPILMSGGTAVSGDVAAAR
jgi:murein DD-endopeptidase MepM/ murein hydrolase activator NlpD